MTLDVVQDRIGELFDVRIMPLAETADRADYLDGA